MHGYILFFLSGRFFLYLDRARRPFHETMCIAQHNLLLTKALIKTTDEAYNSGLGIANITACYLRAAHLALI